MNAKIQNVFRCYTFIKIKMRFGNTFIRIKMYPDNTFIKIKLFFYIQREYTSRIIPAFYASYTPQSHASCFSGSASGIPDRW